MAQKESSLPSQPNLNALISLPLDNSKTTVEPELISRTQAATIAQHLENVVSGLKSEITSKNKLLNELQTKLNWFQEENKKTYSYNIF